MEDNANRLGQAKISKLLWHFSLPAIISTVASSIYVIIDRIFIGQVVGADAIAGMSVTMPISCIILAFGMLVAMGSGALVSIRLGENKRDEAEVVLGNAVTLVFIISIVTTCLFLVSLNRILIVFGASPAILPYAREFIQIILLGSVFQYIVFILPTMMRAEGNPRKSMNITLINVGVNIVLDYVFIYLFGWAVRGAAIATVISQVVSSTLVFRHFCGPYSLLHLRLINLRLRPEIVKRVAAIGMAPFSMQLAASVVITLYNQNLARYSGDVGIGAFGIINSITMFLILPVIGIILGAQPIIGFNYGARLYDRVIEALKDVILAATVITSLGFIILELFPRQLLGVFTNDTGLLDIGTHGMRLIIIMLPVIGFQIVGSHFFQAIGKAGTALMLALLRQVIVLIPALIILPRFLQLNGIWIAGPIADGLAAIITILVLLPEIQTLKKEAALINASKEVKEGSVVSN